ncbi:MAG: sigma-70 family RNA polymerase sigma factor [Myxococcota bacterium]
MDERRQRENEREDAWRAWMVAAQAGDSAAYEKLLLELLPRARRQVGARISDSAAREDIVQNALVSIHRARHSYRADRPFTPWFNAIVRNATIDWVRMRSRQLPRELPLEQERVADRAAEPAPAGEHEALSPDLEQALSTLPQAQRQAVEMIHLEGLSVADAAARAGVTKGALKVRAHRGYQALRSLLRRTDR